MNGKEKNGIPTHIILNSIKKHAFVVLLNTGIAPNVKIAINSFWYFLQHFSDC